MKIFKRVIGKSQAHFLLNKVKNIGINDQCSYNLPIELKEYLLKFNAIAINNSFGDAQHKVFQLATNWSFELDESIYEIIGDNYKLVNNKIVFVFTTDKSGQTPKFQLIRTYFNEMKSNQYEWFKVLYDNNIVGSEISVLVYEEDSKVVLANRIISKEQPTDSLFEDGVEWERIDDDLSSKSEKKIPNSNIKDGKNEIYYGSPGCGKSYFVKQKYEIPDNIVFRTTFHPEYSNSDFIGQITPKVNENNDVIYQFNPGIFTSALIEAYNNVDKRVILIIEEINRGNASSIFGDIFQLLDRDNNGRSIYVIDNENLVSYINTKINGRIIDIFLPSNLSIVATMNTSDQNISPLDTAFKRRWNLIKIKNVFNSDNILANLYVPMTNVKWKHFVEKINHYIIENAEQLNVFGEDKCIGVYFVSKNELSNMANDESEDGQRANKLFSEKVLFYIWNDIAKLAPLLWFKPEYKTFDTIIEGFEKNGIDIFIGSIFGNL